MPVLARHSKMFKLLPKGLELERANSEDYS